MSLQEIGWMLGGGVALTTLATLVWRWASAHRGFVTAESCAAHRKDIETRLRATEAARADDHERASVIIEQLRQVREAQKAQADATQAQAESTHRVESLVLRLYELAGFTPPLGRRLFRFPDDRSPVTVDALVPEVKEKP